MDFNKPSFKFQLLVYKPGRDKPDHVYHFSEGYEVSASGAITFYQFYRDPEEGNEGKPKKVAVASYPAGKWENCFLVDQFNNYLALSANSKKYSTLGSIGSNTSTDSYSNNNTNNNYSNSNYNDSPASEHIEPAEYHQEPASSGPEHSEENNYSSYDEPNFSPPSENNEEEKNEHSEYNSESSSSSDGIIDLDAPSHHHSSYDYNESSSSSSSQNSSDEYASLDSFLSDDSESKSNSNDSSTHENSSSIENNYNYDSVSSESSTHTNTSSSAPFDTDDNNSSESNQDVSIDSIYNAPSAVVSETNTSSYASGSPTVSNTATTPYSSGSSNSSSSYNNGSNNNSYGNSKPAYNNNGKFNKGGNNQQMSFAEMKALKEGFLANSIISYMNMKDKIFNLDEIVAYATRVNANNIRFNPDDIVLVAYNLIKDKKVSPEKYTAKEKQKRLSLYLPPIIKRHGLEKKSMLVTYLNDKEETKDMNLLDLAAWLVYNGYV